MNNETQRRLSYMDFCKHVAKVNIEYLEGRATAEKSMEAISVMIGELSNYIDSKGVKA